MTDLGVGVAAFLLTGVTLPPSGVLGVGVVAPLLPAKLLFEPTGNRR